MNIPGLDDATLRENASADSYARGADYFSRGAVQAVRRTGPFRVEAFVKGSDVLPYTVRIRHDDAGIDDVSCTCPFVAGSWCKHLVAALLACLHPDGPASAAAATVALLDGMDREALVALIKRLVEADPELAERIRHEVEGLR